MREIFLDEEEVGFILECIAEAEPNVLDAMNATGNEVVYRKCSKKFGVMHDLKVKLTPYNQ